VRCFGHPDKSDEEEYGDEGARECKALERRRGADDVGEQDANDELQLEESAKGAAAPLLGDLGAVDGRRDADGASGEAADEAAGGQGAEALAERHQQPAGEQRERERRQEAAPPDPLAQHAGRRRAHHRAERHQRAQPRALLDADQHRRVGRLEFRQRWR
jgi:hypothetical protein